MSDLHSQPIAYDLACLRKVLTDLAPDLLCAEITRETWEREDLTQVSIDVREALATVVASTDIVLIPVAPTAEQYADFAPVLGWRRRLALPLNGLLRWGQIRADDVETVNGPWFGAFCHTACWLTESLWQAQDRARWARQNEELAENIIHAVQRDSGRRVLVAVQCQRLHRLVPLLRAQSNLFEIVQYRSL